MPRERPKEMAKRQEKKTKLSFCCGPGSVQDARDKKDEGDTALVSVSYRQSNYFSPFFWPCPPYVEVHRLGTDPSCYSDNTESLTCCTKELFILFFFFFKSCTCSIWRFPGKGSNPSCSCQPTPQPQHHGILAMSLTYTTAHGKARSLTY